MSDNQGARQTSARGLSGNALDYNGDFLALFDAAGIAAGDFNGRFLAWINHTLSTSYTDLNSAKAALAATNGVADWDCLAALDTTGRVLLESGANLLLETGGKILTEH